MEFERGGAAAPGLSVGLKRMRAAAGAGGPGESLLDRDPAVRRRLAELEIAVTAMDMMERRVLGALAAGGPPGPASSLLKIQGTEALQSVDVLGVGLAGVYAAVEQPDARQPGANTPPIGPAHAVTAMARYLNDRAATIYGGSNEIQRDIIARLVLGL